MDVYIRDVSAFLPNTPVGNDDLEKVLGMVGDLPSRARRVILRSNKIETRYYAINPEDGSPTHTNAQMTAEAVRRLRPYPGFTPGDLECLSCGTSTPDLLIPGHALMVQGELGAGPLEAVTSHAICLSGMAAMKYAYMNTGMGLVKNAVASGSDLASSFIRGSFYRTAVKNGDSGKKREAPLPFDADFLRWTLSDGAGAVYMDRSPNPEGLSLKIEWIEIESHAHALETCMYAGGEKMDDGRVAGWRESGALFENPEKNLMAIKQDVRLLNREITRVCVEIVLPSILRKRSLSPEDVAWFLPHYSSEYFRDELAERLKNAGFEIPRERWFTNLTSKGNTGAASIYIILEELFHSGRLNKGDRLLLFVPESGRFSACYALLTAV